jgi:DNA-binding transcriptional regulator GbsR (MarR family)
VAGRLLGYLLICDPPKQTIAELSDALLASRSAINGAAKLLEERHIAGRSRGAGERLDHVTIDPAGLEPRGFDGSVYRQLADLAREGLTHLHHAAPEQSSVLEEGAALYDFLAEKIPAVLQEWRAHRAAQMAGRKSRRAT